MNLPFFQTLHLTPTNFNFNFQYFGLDVGDVVIEEMTVKDNKCMQKDKTIGDKCSITDGKLKLHD